MSFVSFFEYELDITALELLEALYVSFRWVFVQGDRTFL
jgi:hypothetical protein